MSDTNRWGHRGYVTARQFGQYFMPVPIQSLVLRDYCARKGFSYVLHASENMFPESYMGLEGLIPHLGSYQGLIMCSMTMLPKRAERRLRVIAQILNQGCSLHFVFEDIVVSNSEDVDRLEEVLQLYQLSLRPPPQLDFP